MRDPFNGSFDASSLGTVLAPSVAHASWQYTSWGMWAAAVAPASQGREIRSTLSRGEDCMLGVVSCPSCGRHSNSSLQFDDCWGCGHRFTAAEKTPPPAETVVQPDKLANSGAGPRAFRARRGPELVLGQMVGLALAIAILGTPLYLLSRCSSATEPTEAEMRQSVLAAAEDQRLGRHCLSAWDGSHQVLVSVVKARLRNPASFEHVETSASPVDSEGRNILIMKFRAENGFGGMNVGLAYATMNNGTCSVIVQRIEN